MTYADKLKDPRWQKKRLEILNRDSWACKYCGDTKTTLHVHHDYYFPGEEPWEAEEIYLVTLCEDCHDLVHFGKTDVEKYLISCMIGRIIRDGHDLKMLLRVLKNIRENGLE